VLAALVQGDPLALERPALRALRLLFAGLRASTTPSGATPASAAVTLAVTSSVPTRTEIESSSQRSSCARPPARKPLPTRSFPSEEFCAMQSSAQWWLVRISPSAEMKEPVQPLSSRTVASRTRLSQVASSVTPRLCWMASRGGLSKVHMPSSAATGRAANAATAAIGTSFIGNSAGCTGPREAAKRSW
jgi:hypothetical protein